MHMLPNLKLLKYHEKWGQLNNNPSCGFQMVFWCGNMYFGKNIYFELPDMS